MYSGTIAAVNATVAVRTSQTNSGPMGESVGRRERMGTRDATDRTTELFTTVTTKAVMTAVPTRPARRYLQPPFICYRFVPIRPINIRWARVPHAGILVVGI